MLSRTADSLYWLARYMERVENTARLLDVGMRMASLSMQTGADAGEWDSTLVALGCDKSFYAKHKHPTADAVIDHLTRDPDNPSSILTCIETARRNSRAIRTALTVDMWDAVNSTWLDVRRLKEDDFAPENIRKLLDWVKERSQLFGGTVVNTMLRNDAYWFVRLGTFLERADNTARILDVKYHVLLPEQVEIGGGVDYSQWAAILRAVSALTAYHHVYHESLQPLLIADLLILNAQMPRSLAACYRAICANLDSLAEAYGKQGEAQRLARSMRNRLDNARIEQIFESGLHEFCETVIADNARLGAVIGEQYLV